ncbi:tryptophan-rich sensory protein [Paenibacillus sepulcri]|uniref:Tryptophan-rich sensory protein n=1 Tax=Paenibacillus sepulcri TaxID=359917 RepID=A0ABS7CB88_9BACL|nr:tryptophan-rich sensory protein [Paenibacillus sepulcri]
MYNRNPYRLWNIVGLIAVLIVNALAQYLPLNGKTTAELSAQYPVLITPSDYAFSIWMLIYVLLIGFVFYQLGSRTGDQPSVRSTGPWFFISCLFNIAWVFAWHYEHVRISVFIMIALLLTLIILYQRIRTATSRPAAGEFIWVRLPFSLYFGWITVATIVNIAVGLYQAGWNGFGWSDALWAIVLLAAAWVLALIIGGVFRDPFYVLVFVWAFIAIALKQQDYENIYTVAMVGAILLLVFAIYLIFRRRNVSKW